MVRLTRTIRRLAQSAVMLCTLIINAAGFLQLCLRSPAALAAEHLFLRKQLALYQERPVKPQRVTHGTRCTLVWLSHWFDWPSALVTVQPETFQRWRRQGWCLGWHGPSCPGRPPIPAELQALIRQMAHENLTWGQRRIANELRLKLGLRVSPRTVRKYLPTPLDRAPGHRVLAQRWRTFIRNHAWDLIVRGVSSDLTRGVQALAARMRWLQQRCRGRTVASRWRGIPLRDATCLARLSAPASGPAVWSPVIVGVIRVEQRSPPDGGPSYTHEPSTATRATSVDRVDVCAAGAALCEWQRVGPHTRGTKPLSMGKSRVVPRRRAA
jgi:Homeodomain-like domain